MIALKAEERAALITDCKAEINSLEWQLKMRDSSFLQSCLKRQQIALESLEAKPVGYFENHIDEDGDETDYIMHTEAKKENSLALFTAPPVAVMHPVELPHGNEPAASGYGNGYMVYSSGGDWLNRDDVIECIRAAGYEVKE